MTTSQDWWPADYVEDVLFHSLQIKGFEFLGVAVVLHVRGGVQNFQIQVAWLLCRALHECFD